MLASKHFKVRRRPADDWFDAILNADTQLFLDPFLVFKDTEARWKGAHDAVILHFEHAFRLIAEGNRDPRTVAYGKALHLLTFTEPREFCLGYTERGTAGAGSGKGYARSIAAAISDAIGRGLLHPRHFEELGILNEGIGSDRISDIACTVLKAQLVSYTQAIARRHHVPMARHPLYGAGFDKQRLRWESSPIEVPTNPYTKGPFLFVPRRFLRELPTLNADAWWDSYENEMLRQDMNYEIMGKVSKATIIAAARRDPEAVRRWMANKEGEQSAPYDFERDAKGVWLWDSATDQFTAAHPLGLDPPASEAGFIAVIERVIAQYKLFIEEQGGWSLLWDRDHRDKPESAAQLLFRGVAGHYCVANNISLDREVDLGRGPVDFKVSNGYRHRAHLEIKKIHNGRLWNGLEDQLPSYMRSDEVTNGWLLAMLYRDGRSQEARAKRLPHRVAELATAKRINLRYAVVDARPRQSASRLSSI